MVSFVTFPHVIWKQMLKELVIYAIPAIYVKNLLTLREI